MARRYGYGFALFGSNGKTIAILYEKGNFAYWLIINEEQVNPR